MRVDGGMTASALLMQFQADLLELPVQRPAVKETTALGAAFAAGLAVGFWSDLDELRGLWQLKSEWRPTMDARKRAKLLRKWHKAVQRSLDWVDDDDEESNRRLAVNTCLQGISEWPEAAADITYCIVDDTSIMDATISLTEDQHSLIWYVLKSLSNERAGIKDYDLLMEHADTKDVNNVLQSFMEKVGQWNEREINT
jgi:hypothetical protein